jgi:nicotinate-nucleotide adenylyltransferase
MRLGIFGGSFDPVHYGHLLLAECCREQCRLDRVWFVPAAVAPHKIGRALTAGPQRVDMLRLAIGGQEAFVVSTMELDRGGVSYTVDTLEAIHAEQPDAELFLLVGSDSLADMPNWRQPRRICELALPVTVCQAGGPPPDFAAIAPLVAAERFEAIRRQQVEMPLVDLRASEIRRRVAAGLSIRYRTPRAVEKYIEAEQLYRGPQQ